jgi:hypothetical protein
MIYDIDFNVKLTLIVSILVSDVAVVPRHRSFEYLAFEPAAEVHGLERLLGLLENSVVVFFSLGIMPRCWPSVLGYV